MPELAGQAQKASEEGARDLQEPGMFTTLDEKVISWNGQNFYRACGIFVSKLPDGGESSCVKRINHPGNLHEDYDGRTQDEWDFGFGDLSLEEAICQAVGAASVCWESMEGTGVFNEARARAIAGQLLKRVRDAGPIYG